MSNQFRTERISSEPSDKLNVFYMCEYLNKSRSFNQRCETSHYTQKT